MCVCVSVCVYCGTGNRTKVDDPPMLLRRT
jgi:hypothetical protein